MRHASIPRAIEACLIGGGFLAISFVVFSWPTAGHGTVPALVYLPLPLLLWAAMRFGPVGTNSCLMALALLSISGAVHGLGPFAGGAAADNVLSLQLFLLAVSVPLMFLATAIEERRAAEGRPRQVLEAAPSAMVMMTEEGEITLVNTAVEVVFGYEREELIGHSIEVLIPLSTAGPARNASADAYVDTSKPEARSRRARLRRTLRSSSITTTVRPGSITGIISSGSL